MKRLLTNALGRQLALPVFAIAVATGFAATLPASKVLGQDQAAPKSNVEIGGKPVEQLPETQKRAIEQIVKDYLLANPELLLEVQGALEAKMEKAQAEKLKVAIKEHVQDIYRNPNAAIAGNPNGDITVVEFFDYNCGYCKRGLSGVVELIEKDPKVKVVLKELPILSKGSEEASQVALAARLQGKYWEVHRALLENKGQANEGTALKIAEKAGLDMAKLKADMSSKTVKDEIERIRDLAQKMGISGTPHFLVGDRSIGGAPEDLYHQLSTIVGELRKDGCSVC